MDIYGIASDSMTGVSDSHSNEEMYVRDQLISGGLNHVLTSTGRLHKTLVSGKFELLSRTAFFYLP